MRLLIKYTVMKQMDRKDNKLNRRLKFIILSLMSVLALCCSRQPTDENQQLPAIEAVNFVSLNDAKQVLSLVGEMSRTKSSSKFVEIETVTPVNDSSGNVIFYAVNYQGGGFVLLSADNRTEPVLAFSDVNTFSVEAIPQTGVSVWAEMTAYQMAELRRTNPEQTPLQRAMWRPENIALFLDVDETDRPAPVCDQGHEGYHSIGPLMQTQWGQSYDFNDRVPLFCPNNIIPDEAPVGCVPVAMGQIMKYYEHPYQYNWSLISNTTGGDETSKLLRDIGTNVGIQYGCDGSGAPTETMCVPAFAAFGYRSAIYSDYNPSTVMLELDKGRPVLLKGGSYVNGVYEGHAWVCDGYIYSVFCQAEYAEPGPSLEINHNLSISTMLNMKCGWYGSNDAWYSSTNFNSDSKPYNDRTGMVYNITPQ